MKEGTPLLYDMTLVHINLETEKLNNQQLQIKKKGLESTGKNQEKESDQYGIKYRVSADFFESFR